MLDWRDENLSEKEKDDLLRFAADQWGIPTKVNGTEFILDPSEIKDRIDFYFLLAEIFVEENRFFAFGLDSLEDTLFELRIHENINFKLSIVNIAQLKAVLGEEDTNTFIFLFEEAGVPVNIIN